MTKIMNVISWIVLCSMILLLAIAGRNLYISRTTGEPSYILGYRLVFVTSASMEPTIKTYGAAVSKRVDTIEDIAEGDIISFSVTQDDGTVARATHRIYEIKDNVIYTKGDNNMVIDSYPITIFDVESKVCLIFNFTAWIANKWQSSTAGRVMLCSLALLILFSMFLLNSIGKGEDANEQA